MEEEEKARKGNEEEHALLHNNKEHSLNDLLVSPITFSSYIKPMLLSSSILSIFQARVVGDECNSMITRPIDK